jgi:hypothetical protein
VLKSLQLGWHQFRLQIDIGFGDSIIPAPLNIDYPTLLDLPSPKLRAYSKETVIAEKFHAMVHRGIANSRMKDFYDIWVLATTYTFEANALRNAIQSTFKRRDTPLPVATPLALTVEFAEDSTKLAQWTAFVRKGKLLAYESLALNQIVPILEKFILSPLTKKGNSSWDPKTLNWSN